MARPKKLTERLELMIAKNLLKRLDMWRGSQWPIPGRGEVVRQALKDFLDRKGAPEEDEKKGED